MSKLKNPKKADLNKDGIINSYEETRGLAVEKAIEERQKFSTGRAAIKKNGKIARGCGKVMSNRRKYTTTRQEINMPKKKSTVDPKLQARLDAKVRPDKPVKEDRIYYNMKPKKAPAKKTTKKTKKG